MQTMKPTAVAAFIVLLCAALAVGEQRPPAPDVEIVFWQSIADSKDITDLEDYLRQFPAGTFARLAHRRGTAVLRLPM